MSLYTPGSPAPSLFPTLLNSPASYLSPTLLNTPSPNPSPLDAPVPICVILPKRATYPKLHPSFGWHSVERRTRALPHVPLNLEPARVAAYERAEELRELSPSSDESNPYSDGLVEGARVTEEVESSPAHKADRKGPKSKPSKGKAKKGVKAKKEGKTKAFTAGDRMSVAELIVRINARSIQIDQNHRAMTPTLRAATGAPLQDAADTEAATNLLRLAHPVPQHYGAQPQDAWRAPHPFHEEEVGPLPNRERRFDAEASADARTLSDMYYCASHDEAKTASSRESYPDEYALATSDLDMGSRGFGIRLTPSPTAEHLTNSAFDDVNNANNHSPIKACFHPLPPPVLPDHGSFQALFNFSVAPAAPAVPAAPAASAHANRRYINGPGRARALTESHIGYLPRAERFTHNWVADVAARHEDSGTQRFLTAYAVLRDFHPDGRPTIAFDSNPFISQAQGQHDMGRPLTGRKFIDEDAEGLLQRLGLTKNIGYDVSEDEDGAEAGAEAGAETGDVEMASLNDVDDHANLTDMARMRGDTARDGWDAAEVRFAHALRALEAQRRVWRAHLKLRGHAGASTQHAVAWAAVRTRCKEARENADAVYEYYLGVWREVGLM